MTTRAPPGLELPAPPPEAPPPAPVAPPTVAAAAPVSRDAWKVVGSQVEVVKEAQINDEDPRKVASSHEEALKQEELFGRELQSVGRERLDQKGREEFSTKFEVSCGHILVGGAERPHQFVKFDRIGSSRTLNQLPWSAGSGKSNSLIFNGLAVEHFKLDVVQCGFFERRLFLQLLHGQHLWVRVGPLGIWRTPKANSERSQQSNWHFRVGLIGPELQFSDHGRQGLRVSIQAAGASQPVEHCFQDSFAICRTSADSKDRRRTLCINHPHCAAQVHAQVTRVTGVGWAVSEHPDAVAGLWLKICEPVRYLVEDGFEFEYGGVVFRFHDLAAEADTIENWVRTLDAATHQRWLEERMSSLKDQVACILRPASVTGIRRPHLAKRLKSILAAQKTGPGTSLPETEQSGTLAAGSTQAGAETAEVGSKFVFMAQANLKPKASLDESGWARHIAQAEKAHWYINKQEPLQTPRVELVLFKRLELGEDGCFFKKDQELSNMGFDFKSVSFKVVDLQLLEVPADWRPDGPPPEVAAIAAANAECRFSGPLRLAAWACFAGQPRWPSPEEGSGALPSGQEQQWQPITWVPGHPNGYIKRVVGNQREVFNAKRCKEELRRVPVESSKGRVGHINVTLEYVGFGHFEPRVADVSGDAVLNPGPAPLGQKEPDTAATTSQQPQKLGRRASPQPIVDQRSGKDRADSGSKRAPGQQAAAKGGNAAPSKRTASRGATASSSQRTRSGARGSPGAEARRKVAPRGRSSRSPPGTREQGAFGVNSWSFAAELPFTPLPAATYDGNPFGTTWPALAEYYHESYDEQWGQLPAFNDASLAQPGLINEFVQPPAAKEQPRPLDMDDPQWQFLLDCIDESSEKVVKTLLLHVERAYLKHVPPDRNRGCWNDSLANERKPRSTEGGGTTKAVHKLPAHLEEAGHYGKKPEDLLKEADGTFAGVPIIEAEWEPEMEQAPKSDLEQESDLTETLLG